MIEAIKRIVAINEKMLTVFCRGARSSASARFGMKEV
jgi:hypothetical protein